jgi:hypothetical protein
MGKYTVFTTVRTKPDVIIHDMETHKAINISQYRVAAVYNETGVKVFLKQLRYLTKLKFVKTNKQLFIESIPYLSIYT